MDVDSPQRAPVRLVNATVLAPEALPDAEVIIADGSIAADTPAGAVELDCGGDYLIPGLIDLHTDNIEHHFHPRPGVVWPSGLAAAIAHDGQMLAAGITTVLDSLSLGDYDSSGARTRMLNSAIDGVDRAREAGVLKADHYFHFRCELSDPGMLPMIEARIDNPRLRLLSMMDHTPGQRQWHDVALYREFRRKKNNQVWSDAEFDLYLADRQAKQARLVPQARAMIAAHGRERQIRIASHDDTTLADVQQSYEDGITISEFPTTVEAARRARALGQQIVMGSPNVVLGGSHSGNVGALQLAEQGLLDVLTSDYVPSSLLHGAFFVGNRLGDLAAAGATVTANPAAILEFGDRGRIAAGLRADLLLVRLIDSVPVVRAMWVGGRRYL